MHLNGSSPGIQIINTYFLQYMRVFSMSDSAIIVVLAYRSVMGGLPGDVGEVPVT